MGNEGILTRVVLGYKKKTMADEYPRDGGE